MDIAPMIPGAVPVDLDAVRARRASLRRACSRVRHLLDAVGPVGTDGATAAREEMLSAVTDLDRVWTAHTAATEGADGMLAQVLADCPRLAGSVQRLRSEHEAVATRLHAVRNGLAATAAPDPTEPADPTEWRDPVRDAERVHERLGDVLDAVDRHRRAGRELLYTAYQVDLGLGE
jgi:hypothetical protein